jgi:hypothetical protein
VLAFQTVEEPVTTFERDEDYSELFRLMAPLPSAQVCVGASAHADPAWYRAHSTRRPATPDDESDGLAQR